MKKIILILLAAAIVLLSACGMNPDNKPSQDNESIIPENSGTRTFTDSSRATESAAPPEGAAGEKMLLKLKKFDMMSEGETEIYNEEEAAEFAVKTCALEVSLPECKTKPFVKSAETKVLTDYISDELNTEIDGKWLFTVHYFDARKTAGQIKFLYRISEEIKTNRAIVFFIEDGKIGKVTYSYLDAETDEAAIIEKYKNFVGTHEQERINPLGNDYKIIDETTDFVYNYKTGKLKYSYGIFFENIENGIINNDYGTEVTVE